MKETKDLDYKKEYIGLTIKNSELLKENEKLKKTILSMAAVYTTVDELEKVAINIEKELKRINRRINE